MTIRTQRIILRPWQEKDLQSFAELNADPRVMEYFPSIKSFDESMIEYNDQKLSHLLPPLTSVQKVLWSASECIMIQGLRRNGTENSVKD